MLEPVAPNIQIERSISFLRQIHPAIDVPSGLIAKELLADRLANESDGSQDLFSGQCLTVTRRRPDRDDVLVCSAGGETGNELFVSPFRIGGNRREGGIQAWFHPSDAPARRFSTPIQQIVAAPLEPALLKSRNFSGAWLAVRTVASTKICSIAKEDGPKGGHEPFILNSVFDITQAAMHGRQHAHAAFNPLAKTEALIVNRIGDLGLWEANLGARKWHEHGVSFRSVEDEQGATFDELGTQADPFWQIAFGWEPGAAYLASCSTLYAIDFRTPKRRSLFSPGAATDVLNASRFTSLLSGGHDGGRPYLCASTTSEVMWFDPRNPGQPLLSWQHHRGEDRSLALSAVPGTEDTPTVILSSRRNRLLTAYSASHSETLISSQGMPYQIPSSLPSGALPGSSPFLFDFGEVLNYETLQHHRKGSIASFELSDRGAVWRRDFIQDTRASVTISRSSDPPCPVAKRRRIDEMQEEAEQPEDLGPHAPRERTMIDLSAVYRAAMNGALARMSGAAPSSRAEGQGSLIQSGPQGELVPATRQLNRMATALQEIEAPPKEMSNLYEVAVAAAEEEEGESYTPTFLSPNALPAEPLRAREELSAHLNRAATLLRRDALWSTSLEQLLARSYCEALSASTNSQEQTQSMAMGANGSFARWELAARTLADRYLPSSDAANAPSSTTRRDIEASSHQVALDLALSAHVFSMKSIPGPEISARAHVEDAINVDAEPATSQGQTVSESARSDVESTAVQEPMSSATRLPPEVDFAFFAPRDVTRAENRVASNVAQHEPEESVTTLAARLLLSEWTLGTSPDAYEYHDPYAAIDAAEAAGTEATFESSNMAAASQASQSSRAPPTIGSASQSQSQGPACYSQPVGASRRPPVLGRASLGPSSQPRSSLSRAGRQTRPATQGLDASARGMPPPSAASSRSGRTSAAQQQYSQLPVGMQSQESQSQSMASQVVPGRFGARPAGSKKPGKRRVGGF